ncbi:MAG: FAD:protein FMN transferase [Firmicutes bacterium]|nr:FAD:protein FMN transferase [Bacillota bacterium]
MMTEDAKIKHGKYMEHIIQKKPIRQHKKNLVASFLLITGLCVTCLLSVSGCSKEQKRISKNGFYFDTIISITLYGTDDDSSIDQCFSMAKEYEQKFSNTIENSEISKINAAGGEYVTVSHDTVRLLTDAIRYGDISRGKFDVTIGGLSDLWNISEIAKNLETEDNEADASVLPAQKEIEKELSHVDYRNIEISGNQVRLKDPEAKLDVGGIAKGFIADQMREYLTGQGITEGVISLGGNVLTLGPKQSKDAYTIGIQKPFADTGTAMASLSVKDASVVTSGIYERYYRVDGKLYHHILDTKTGYPVENHIEQVTIISEKSIDGDALSTACFALGLEQGMELIENTDGVEALFLTDDGKFHQSTGIGDGKRISLKLLE